MGKGAYKQKELQIVKENKSMIKIGISVGDINGIGPEIILKCFNHREIFKYCIPIVYSPPYVLNFYRKQLNLNDVRINPIKNVSDARPKAINVIDCFQNQIAIQSGQFDQECGKLAASSLNAVAEDLLQKNIDACVTAPINKENVQNAGLNFPGQTEFFTQKAGASESIMLLCSDKMRIALVTGHNPISEVASKINSDLINSKLKLLISSLKKDFGIAKPKIAVLGLNPHAGENGKIGLEEVEIIAPLIKKFKDKGEFINGPYPSDGLFGSGNYRKFDGILAMYHDQALIPFKMISFEDGVNFTAGLNLIRTSPDHGTAFDIAGKGIASESSFRKALFMAIDISRQRNENY
ncbi:MAG: 4-hydroxythreonine-4-phosphate dehydrogenase PdxA [Cytophagales bacterium]